MKHYIKNALLPFIYLFFMAITAFGIMAIQNENLTWLKYSLCVLNLALYALIVAMFTFKVGQEGVKVRNANDLERKQIILTGEARPLKLAEEYKAYKGFIMGFIVCVPLLLCLLAHTITILCGGGNGFGVAGSLYYLVVYSFFSLGFGTPTPTTFYWSLFSLPVIMTIMGVAYYMGGRKIELQQQKIKEQQKRIYGE